MMILIKISLIGFISVVFYVNGSVEYPARVWDVPQVIVELKKTPNEKLTPELEDAVGLVEKALALLEKDPDGFYLGNWQKPAEYLKKIIDQYASVDDIRMKRLTSYAMSRSILLEARKNVEEHGNINEKIKRLVSIYGQEDDPEIQRNILEAYIDRIFSTGLFNFDANPSAAKDIIENTRLLLPPSCLDNEDERMNELYARYLVWGYGFSLCYGWGDSLVAGRVYDEMEKRYGTSTNPRIQSCIIRAMSTKANMGITDVEELRTSLILWTNSSYQMKWLFDEMVQRYGTSTNPVIQEAVAREMERYISLEYNLDNVSACGEQLRKLYGDSTHPLVLRHVIEGIVCEIERYLFEGSVDHRKVEKIMNDALHKYADYPDLIWTLKEYEKAYEEHWKR